MKQFIYVWYSTERYYKTDLPFIYIGSHRGNLDDNYISSSKFLSYEMQADNCKWKRVIIKSFDLSFDRKLINNYESKLIQKAFLRYGKDRCVNKSYNQFGNKHKDCTGLIKLYNPKTGKIRLFKKHLKEVLLKKGWVKTKGTTINTFCITNGVKNKFVKSKENIPEGWYIGMTSNNENRKGSIPVGNVAINKKGKHRFVEKHHLEKFLNDGWVLGFSEKYYEKRNLKTVKNKKRIVKNNTYKFINENELENYLKEGWVTPLNSIPVGSVCINNGIKNKYIKKEELNYYLDVGWILGGLSKKGSTIGKIAINDGYKNKFIKEDELQEYLNLGWVKGGKSIKKNFEHEHKNKQNKNQH